MFLYGKNSVRERLRSKPRSIKKIYLEEGFSDEPIERLVRTTKVSCKIVSKKELYRIKRADSLGGIVAEAEEFKYADFEDLLRESDNKKLSFVFLDRIFDPQNLGAMIRTAACLGNLAIIIPRHKACAVTDSVLRVASGGENYTPVSMVSNLTNAILKAKKNGHWIVGADVNEGKDIQGLSLPFPLSLVLGSESKGIRYGVDKHLDLKVRIPMAGASLSFNVAIAFAIFAYEITKQKQAL